MAAARALQSIDELRAALERDIGKDLHGKLEEAIDETVLDSQGIVWTHVPFAFGELHNSVHPEGRQLVADAPHAAAVEVGSLPHMPPVEPIEKWCELKGFDDPKGAAWAIAKKIAAEGTKPTHYMRGSLPEIRNKLDEHMKKAAGK